MGAAAADYDAFDRCAADAARLPGTRVDVMVKLEETGNSVCVYVIGD